MEVVKQGPGAVVNLAVRAVGSVGDLAGRVIAPVTNLVGRAMGPALYPVMGFIEQVLGPAMRAAANQDSIIAGWNAHADHFPQVLVVTCGIVAISVVAMVVIAKTKMNSAHDLASQRPAQGKSGMNSYDPPPTFGQQRTIYATPYGLITVYGYQQPDSIGGIYPPRPLPPPFELPCSRPAVAGSNQTSSTTEPLTDIPGLPNNQPSARLSWFQSWFK